MKKIYCALFCLFISGAIIAKEPAIAHRGTTNKTTSATKRIKAFAYRRDNMLCDTATYYYSGTHTSDFPTCIENFELTGVAFYPQKTPGIVVDSYYYHNIVTGIGGTNDFVKVTYDAGLNAGTTEERSIYSWTKNIGSYTGGLLTSVDEYDTTGGGSMTHKRTRYKFYDVAERNIEDSIYSLAMAAPLEKTVFYYSAMLDSEYHYTWASGAWLHSYTIWHTYNAFGLVTSQNALSYVSSFVPYKDTFAYDGSNPNYIFYSYSDYAPSLGSWVVRDQRQYHLNAAGKWDTVFYSTSDLTYTSVIPVEKDPVFYNTEGLMDSTKGYKYDLFTNQYADTSYDKNIYYYESNTVAVPVISNSVEMHIFPNPAHQQATITFTGCSGQYVDVAVADVMGKTLISLYNSEIKNGSMQVDLRSLPAGTYVMSVISKSSNVVHREKISVY